MLRKSRFNIAVPGDAPGETLLFNTATGAFAVLDARTCAAYDACDAAAAPALEANGFLTSLTPAEELAAQRSRFETQRHEHDALTLSLVPTYACNYRCPYCYEQGIPAVGGVMAERVIDGILDFIEARYAAVGFQALEVQWYGGDPSLALPAVEELSENMIAWCDEVGVAYNAMILTNCNLIDEAAVAMLAHNRVSQALLTIDGFEETHNKRRVAANGRNSYSAVIAAARLFIAHGVQVSAVMNVDRVNWHEYAALRKQLADDPGLPLSFERLADCGHFFGTRDFKKPAFDLFDIAEYAQLQHDEFTRGGITEGMLRELLRAPKRFCNGQRDDYYVIDLKGDVYACDGYVGNPEHVRFNIFDANAPWHHELLSHDPFASAQCCACELLPICLGNCNWERETDAMQCHPLKWTIGDYLRDLQRLAACAESCSR